ncbi:hypothetical protein M8J76_008091 [Diaphorina citri]|nr:hypothetical protein M8J76_008091 [Diaphorina citri]
MESKLPKNLSVDHSFIPGGRFHDISSKCIKKYENCDHLIVMAGTNDIGKTSFKEIKTHIENIIIKFKDSKIHLVLVPDRFDKVTMNLDIKILNDKIKTLVKDYKNITIYHTTSIVDSWDYCDNIHFGPNGKEKLSNAICKEILSTMHHQNLSSTNKRKFTKSKSNVFRREVNYYSKPNDHRNAHSNKEYYSSEHHKYSSTKPNKRKSNQSFCGQEEYFYSNPNYDLAIAKPALQIQSMEAPAYDKIFIQFGAFHIFMAYFSALGKLMAESGYAHVLGQSEILGGNAIKGVLSGRHFNRM